MLGPSASIPDDALDVIIRWVGDGRSQDRKSADIEKTAISNSRVAHGSGYQERAVRFGPDDRLFGILSVPSGVDVGAPAIIFLNTGAEYRGGAASALCATLTSVGGPGSRRAPL